METAARLRDELFPAGSPLHNVWALVLADGETGQLDSLADPSVKGAYIGRRCHVRVRAGAGPVFRFTVRAVPCAERQELCGLHRAAAGVRLW